MSKEEISVTRALSELKLLDSRIQKEISNTKFVDLFQNRKDLAMGSNCTKKEFETNVKAKMQSATDLIERRKAIKSAVTKSNATTKVKISNDTYTVAEAIDRKGSIVYDRALLTKMKNDYTVAIRSVEQNRAQLDQNINNLVNQSLGSDKKVEKDAFESIAKPILDANELHVLDPANVQTKIDQLDKQIDEFMSEVDFVLSESNSRTTITV